MVVHTLLFVVGWHLTSTRILVQIPAGHYSWVMHVMHAAVVHVMHVAVVHVRLHVPMTGVHGYRYLETLCLTAELLNISKRQGELEGPQSPLCA